MSHIKVTWEEVENLVAEIANKMIVADFKPDIIVTILRGGVVPARLLCNYFEGVSLCTVTAKLYDKVDDWQTEEGYLGAIGAVEVGKIDLPIYGKEKIVVIDDISDSGKTFSAVIETIYDKYSGFYDGNKLYDGKILKTASLYLRDGSEFTPDFYGEKVCHKEWFDFPWEKKSITPRLKSRGLHSNV